MKRIYILLLTALLLAGCGADDPQITTQQTTVEETQTTTEPGLYEPESRLELATGGAVQVYPLGSGRKFAWISSLGSDLMVATDGSNSRVMVLSGENCAKKYNMVVRELEITAPENTYAGITGGFASYSSEKKQVLYYNTALTQTKKLQLPQNISGTVGILEGSGKVFYSAGSEIYENDPATGIVRMVRQFSATGVEIMGSYCGGQILQCRLTDDSGQVSVTYISSQTGQTMSADPGLTQLDTHGESFFATRMDGVLQLQLFGNKESVSQLNVQQGSGSFHSALAVGGVVHSQVNENNAVVLNYYDLSTGMRKTELVLEDVSLPSAYYADRSRGCIWFITKEQSTNIQLLCKWNINIGNTGDETIYSGGYYTAQAPDAEGLAACQQRVDALNSKYFTRILIWQEALEKTQGYSLVGEHQVSVINGMLDEIEAFAAQLPEDFLWDSADGTDSNRLRICLVREIADGSAGKQYWYDGECYILITSGADVQQELLKGLSYAVVSHILGNSVEIDAWTAYNPADFVYGSGEQDCFYEGERCFVDPAAMKSLTDDRCLTFVYAASPGNEELFNSVPMQNKLKQLCVGIRDAYRLGRYEQVLPWEQYLGESLAYQPNP